MTPAFGKVITQGKEEEGKLDGGLIDTSGLARTRVGYLSARARELPYLPSCLDPPLQIRHVWLVTFHRDVPPARPQLRKDMDHAAVKLTD